MYIKLGKGIHDYVHAGQFSVNLSAETSILEQIKEWRFYVKAIEEKGYMVGGHKKSLPIELEGENKTQLSHFKEHLQKLENMRLAMDYLGIEDPGGLKEYTDNELHFLGYIFSRHILRVIENNNDNPYNFSSRIYGLVIAGRKILALHINNELINVFSERFLSLVRCVVTDPKGKSFRVSPFARLLDGRIFDFDNFNSAVVIASIKQTKIPKEAYDGHINWLLDSLRSLDRLERKAEIMNFATYFANYLYEIDGSHINAINKMQVKYRAGNLTGSDIEEIENILSATKDDAVRCASYILLKRYPEFNDLFGKLTEEKRTEFRVWPIYSLIKDNINEAGV